MSLPRLNRRFFGPAQRLLDRLPWHLSLGLALASVCAGAFVLDAGTGRAAPGEWPIGRHDSARTGAVELSSTFASAPSPTWRHYVGGTMSQYVLADVDGDDAEDLFYLSGGVLYHKSPDNVALWDRPVPADQLYGPMDLNGDGDMELLVVQSTPVRILVISAADGSVLWTFKDSTEIGTVGSIRVRDLNADGIEDLLVEECHCCTYNSGKPGFTLTFKNGFSAPTRMYNIGSDCGAGADVFADVDNTGLQYWEIGYNAIRGTDTTTGASKYYLTTSVLRANTSVRAVDVEGDGSDELLFYNYYYYAGQGVPRFGMWDYNTSANNIQVAWEKPLTDPVNDRVEGGVDWVGDLDGNGTIEMVLSVYSDAADIWTLYVLDAKTGTYLGQLIDERILSVVQLDTEPGLEFLSSDPDRTQLHAWRWTPDGFLPLWTLEDRWIVTERERDEAKTSYYSKLVTLDQDGDGQIELPLIVWDARQNNVNLVLVDPSEVANEAPVELARTSIPAGLELERAVRCDGFDEAFPGLCMVRTDGYLQALDDALQVLNQDGPEPAFLPGLQLGGYVPSDTLGSYPLVAKLKGAEPARVWTRNSQGFHVALDPAGASLFTPAQTKLQFEASAPPAVVDLEGDGNRELIFIDLDGRLHVRRSDGLTDAWTATWAPDDATPNFGIAVGDANADATLDVFYAWYTREGYSKVVPLNGKSGVRLWSAPFAIQAQWGALPFSVNDVDVDGDADLITTWNYLYIQDGKTGTSLLADTTFQAYGVPIAWNIDSDATLEILQHGGYYADRMLDLNLSTKTAAALWNDSDGLRTGQQGTIVTCSASDIRFVKGFSADDRFQVFSLKTGAKLADWRAAGGRLFATTADRDAAGVEPGLLTHMTSSPDLTGQGVPGVIFGSTDGYLYAFNPCNSANSLLWYYYFGPRVGAPILADTDADGKSELLVHVGDGFLYHFDTLPQSAPLMVNDLASLSSSADVDVLETIDTLYGGWDPVPGAQSYDIGVLSAANTFVTSPSFLNVSGTSASLPGLSLCDGATYRVAVRARSSSGVSPEVLSDGVRVQVGELCDGRDNNCNGRIDEGFDADGDGSVSCVTGVPADCNDADPNTYPGAPERCDGKDNDCDGVVDDNATDATTWYGDTDKDGYGNPEYIKVSCTQPRNFVTNNLDCDDTEKTTYPGAPEVCDELDNNCDGQVDEGVQTTFYQDSDDDGYGSAAAPQVGCTLQAGQSLNASDCNDSDANIHPGAIEACDGIDQDCDLEVDEGVTGTWFADQDADTWGDPLSPIQACTQPAGSVTDSRDCDDSSSAIYPGASEVCGDGIDQDCTGYDLGCGDVDNDLDGFTEVQGDCDDTNNGIYPTATDIPYNNVDEDCSGADLTDVDEDGFDARQAGGLDCDDDDPQVNPAAEELCDGIDNNCDDVVDDRDADVDGEVAFECDGPDCNDADPNINASGSESPDGVDNDCDGVTDEGTTAFDDDGDGFTEAQNDCDDTRTDINPAQPELPDDGLDNDCDGELDEATPTPEPTPTSTPEPTPTPSQTPDTATPDQASPTARPSETPVAPTASTTPDPTATATASPATPTEQGDGEGSIPPEDTPDPSEGCACSQDGPVSQASLSPWILVAGVLVMRRRRQRGC